MRIPPRDASRLQPLDKEVVHRWTDRLSTIARGRRSAAITTARDEVGRRVGAEDLRVAEPGRPLYRTERDRPPSRGVAGVVVHNPSVTVRREDRYRLFLQRAA